MMNFLLSAMALVFPSVTEAVLWKANKQESKGSELIFIGKFAFGFDKGGGEVGTIQFDELTVPSGSVASANEAGFEIFLFDDEDFSWPTIYNNASADDCTAWNAARKNVEGGSSIVVFSEDGTASDLYATPIYQKTRSRFWYVCIATCGVDTPSISFNWELHMYRYMVGDWNKEFGMDEKGLNTIYLAFFFLYTLVLAVQGFAAYRFKSNMGYVHPIVKGFTAIVFMEWLYCLFKVIHFCVFAGNGVGVKFFDMLGDIIEIFPRALFILLLLLLASGWLISYSGGIKKAPIIFGVTLGLLACFITSIIWGFASYTPEAVDIPSSLKTFQIGFTLFWFLVAIMFCVIVFMSFRKEDNPSKSQLYFRMLILYGIWFTGVPVITLLSFALESWVRERLVVTFSLFVTMLGVFFMTFLLDPSRAEDYFDMSKRNDGAVTALAWERL